MPLGTQIWTPHVARHVHTIYLLTSASAAFQFLRCFGEIEGAGEVTAWTVAPESGLAVDVRFVH